MKTIGHVRVQVGDAYILGAAYRALQADLDAGSTAVSEPGMQRFRAILEDVRLMARMESDVASRDIPNDVWGVAA